MKRPLNGIGIKFIVFNLVAILAIVGESRICLANKLDLSTPEVAYRAALRCAQQGSAEEYWDTLTDSGRLRYGRTKAEQVEKIKSEFEYMSKNPQVFDPKDLDVDITDTIYSNDGRAALVVAEEIYKGQRMSSEASVIMILEESSWKVLFARASGGAKSRAEFKSKSSTDILREFNALAETLNKLSAQVAAQSSDSESSPSKQVETDKVKTNVVQTGSVVTVGIPNSSTFSESVKKAGDFFEPYRKARERIMAGDYQAAILLLDESLKHVSSKIDFAMAYRFLIGIYGDLGDLENELKSIELFTNYTMNQNEKQQFQEIAEHIRVTLERKQTPITMADRYPIKAIYGGPRFNSYREILIAQEQSRFFLKQGDQAVKDKRFEDAIGHYCASYIPGGWDNESIKIGLIKAYAQVGRYADSLEVLDDTRSTLKVLGSEEVLNGKIRERLQKAIKEGKLVLTEDIDKFPEELFLGAKPKPPVPKDFRGDTIKDK